METEEHPKYQVKGEKAQNAKTTESGEAVQADKPKSQRRNRNKKSEKPKETEGEAKQDNEPNTQNGDATENKKEKKPRQRRERKPKKDTEEGEAAEGKNQSKYRVKGDKPEGEKGDVAEGAENVSNQKDQADEAPKKRKRNNKNKEQKENGQSEPKYRKKGDKTEEAEEQTAEKKGDKNEKDNKDNKKKDEPKKEKNLIYKNPMDFKEKKKFKSKWEEYHYGEWKRGSGKTFVTLETVIPPIPEKKIAAPDEANYRKKKQDIDDAIAAINKSLNDKKASFEEILASKQAARSSNQQQNATEEDKNDVKGKSLKELFARMGELQKQKKTIYAAQDKILEAQNQLTKEKEQLSKLIDKRVQKAKDIPKALKECQKELETSSSSIKKEKELIQRMKILKDSIPHIEKRDIIDEKIDAQYKLKKESSKGLPKILQESKALQAQIDDIKKNQEQKTDTLNAFDDQLNRISDKRKKDWDAKDKLRKQKDELNDDYYGSLILYSKFQYLLSDIKWMTDMQNMLKDKAAAKQKYEDEKRARKEKYEREKEERRKREEERKQREEERKEKIAAQKKAMEENLRQTEIDGLAKLQADIEDKNVGNNPMIGVIEQIDYLQKLCKRRLALPEEEESKTKEATEEAKEARKNELDAKLKKGTIMAAPTKEQRLAEISIAQKGKKGGKKQKKNQQEEKSEGSLDFSTVKKFGAVKLAPPLTNEEYEKSIKDLDVLREAIVYWGKIQQRIRKVKFIRDSRKIFSEDEFKTICEDEEKFIDVEKTKYSGDSTEGHEVDAEKLKIAQIIFRENTMRQAWNAEDDGDDYQSSDEDRGFNADEAGDEENPLVQETTPEDRERREKRPKRENKPKATKRPNKESFKKIMGSAEAFPTLENDFEDDELSEGDEEEEETPVAEPTQNESEVKGEENGETAAEKTETA